MAKTNHVARPMNSVSEFNSQVDIIVPFHGQYDLVTQLIQSLFKLTRSNYYRVYLVDDCSANPNFIMNLGLNAQKNAERLQQPNVLNTTRHDEQKGFGASCKTGFDLGESPYVCFLNSDCRIEDSGWLRNLGESLLSLKSQNVRVVAPMTNNPVHGDPAQKGDKFSRSSDDVVLNDDSFLSLPCFMCHRDLFSKIGGFLKEYPYAGYEDEEFAHRLKYHNFKQAVCRSSFVYHKGEATIKDVMRKNPNEVRKNLDSNRERCISDIKSLSKK